MRVMVRIAVPLEKGNEVTKAGKMSETIQSLLADLDTEAVCLTLERGQRALHIFMNVQGGWELPQINKPWFPALNASMEIHPVVVPEVPVKAGPKIEEAVREFV